MLNPVRIGYTFNSFPGLPVSAEDKTAPAKIRGCTGFDGGVEAGEASRSLPVCVKKGNLKINAKNNRSLAVAA